MIKQKVILVGGAFLLILVIAIILFQISKSRTFQFFGEIYPRIETKQKVVSLTFDDGPTKAYTDEILTVLRDEKIKATFYVMGAEIEKKFGRARKNYD